MSATTYVYILLQYSKIEPNISKRRTLIANIDTTFISMKKASFECSFLLCVKFA